MTRNSEHPRKTSELAALNALVISYLRRNTLHTAKAKSLFVRLWTEKADELLDILPSRWLISTLQTFMIHGATADQRATGAAWFYYGNLVKLYESERRHDRLHQRRPYADTAPTKGVRVRGMGNVKTGYQDLAANLHIQAYTLIAQDTVAGPILERLIATVKEGQTVSQRMDRSRLTLPETEGLMPGGWSFGDEPEEGSSELDD